MIIVIEPRLNEMELWAIDCPKNNGLIISQIIKLDGDVQMALTNGIKNLCHDEEISAISIRLLIGGDIFDEITVLDDSFFKKYSELLELMPIYVSNTLEFIKNLYKAFHDIPVYLIFETGFFRKLPDAEKHYAVPNEYLGNGPKKRMGFHGIWHSYNCHVPEHPNKTISVVFDRYTTVCALRMNQPVTISFGCTPLEGIMGKHSCGEIDAGIIFYLMHHLGYSVHKIDEILKKESGFLGLTGIDLDINEMLKFCGKEDNINQAVKIYFNQLKQYVGESIAILEGVSELVFSGKSIQSLIPIIFYLIKEMSCFDIALKPLPWPTSNNIFRITTDYSKIQVYMNTQSLPEVIYSLTADYIKGEKMVHSSTASVKI
jgi:acetate kinase